MGELNDLNVEPVFKEENVELYSDFEMEERELWERPEQLRIQEQQMRLEQLRHQIKSKEESLAKFHRQEQGQDWSFPKPRSVKPEVVASTTENKGMTDWPGSESAAFLTSKELRGYPIDPASFQTPIDELFKADNKLPMNRPIDWDRKQTAK